jgi:hypothetical protein
MHLLGWLGAILVVGVLLIGALLLLLIRPNKHWIILAQELAELVGKAKALGLPDRDVANVKDMLEYAEYGEALSILAAQLYEHRIFLDADYYQLLQSVAEKLKLPEQEYLFAKELIK